MSGRNPYRLDRPAYVAFSGGRTSGYMLYHVIQAFGGTLPDDVKVIFANTGKEREETLEFVARCAREWCVPITWLEYRYTRGVGASFAEVDFASASRAGEPLEATITAHRGPSNFLPGPLARYCTVDCKILTIIRYLESLGWEAWTSAVGFRADEPRRIAKLQSPLRDSRDTTVTPLAEMGVSRADVLAWWRGQPFDLALGAHESNCDLCFLKGQGKLLEIMHRRPELADWWIRMEANGGRFRRDRLGYTALLQLARRPTLFDAASEPDDLSAACHCTD